MKIKRRQFLVDAPFQLSIIGYFTLLAIISLCIFYGSELYFFWKWKQIGHEAGLESGHVFFRFLEEQRRVMSIVFWSTASSSILVMGLGGLILSHRVAGPLVKIRAHLLKYADSKEWEEIRVRRNDYFISTVQAINQFIKSKSKCNEKTNAKESDNVAPDFDTSEKKLILFRIVAV